MIERTEYQKKLISFKDKQLIKVVTGVRRSGKSTLLNLFQEYLKSNGVLEEQIQSINFEDLAYSHLLDSVRLYEHIKSRAVKGKQNYIFLDEIQNVKDFERTVDSLFIQEGFDIYITGNAFLLSSQLATLLSGRYVEIKILPLSFKEFVSSRQNMNVADNFSRYLEFGSFPFIRQIENDELSVKNYLSDILNSIVVKDVLIREKINDTSNLLKILRFLFDTVGNLISIKKISDTLTSDGFKITPQTVEKYVTALAESYIIYRASRYDIKGKKYLQSGDKYYIVDTGLRYALLGKKGIDIGHLLENIVYLELLRRGYTVFVGKLDNIEVDFVALNDDGVVYYQVAASVLDENVLRREITPLQSIKDHYPKYLLTLDALPTEDYDGIKRCNVLDWLLQ